MKDHGVSKQISDRFMLCRDVFFCLIICLDLIYVTHAAIKRLEYDRKVRPTLLYMCMLILSIITKLGVLLKGSLKLFYQMFFSSVFCKVKRRRVFLWVSVVSSRCLFTNENLNLRSAIIRKTRKSCGRIGEAKQFCGQGVAFKTGP